MKFVKKRRRMEGKTDYNARKELLKSKRARIVFRKTNRYVIGQYVKSEEAKDKVVTGLMSKELIDYGWPKTFNVKSLIASYLTGYLLGKKILDKGEKEGIFDSGLLRSVKKSRMYAFLKGVVDSGVKVKCKEEMFPEEKRIKNENSEKIKEKIDKRFV